MDIFTNIEKYEEKYKEKIKDGINQKDGEFGNGILYKMCEENPRHDSQDVVSGKVWLIGRAYSAAIERFRYRKLDIINDDFYKQMSEDLSNSRLDEKLQELRNIQSITKESIHNILSVHKYLQDKIFEIIKKSTTPETGVEKRSLCSKYLHFHLPSLFFIYDSRVAEALQKLYPGRLKGFQDVLDGGFDETYATFFCKVFVLKNEIEEKFDLKITPRQIDNFLIDFFNRRS